MRPFSKHQFCPFWGVCIWKRPEEARVWSRSFKQLHQKRGVPWEFSSFAKLPVALKILRMKTFLFLQHSSFCIEIRMSWISKRTSPFIQKGHVLNEGLFFLLSLRCYFGLEDLEPYYALKHLFFRREKESCSYSFSMSDLFWMMDWLSRWSISFLREGHWRTHAVSIEAVV